MPVRDKYKRKFRHPGRDHCKDRRFYWNGAVGDNGNRTYPWMICLAGTRLVFELTAIPNGLSMNILVKVYRIQVRDRRDGG